MLVIVPGIQLQYLAHIISCTATLPSCWCYSGIGTALSNGTYHFHICTKTKRMCPMGPQEGQIISGQRGMVP